MSPNTNVLDTDDLKQIMGYERQGDIERCLKNQGIRFFPSKKGPWTTIDLVNAAGGLRYVGLPKQRSEGIL